MFVRFRLDFRWPFDHSTLERSVETELPPFPGLLFEAIEGRNPIPVEEITLCDDLSILAHLAPIRQTDDFPDFDELLEKLRSSPGWEELP
jgi:hypothetical protein